MDFKTKGNAAFAAQKWQEAAQLYTQALEADARLVAAWANRAACWIQLQEWARGVNDCSQGLAVSEASPGLQTKMWYRKAVCEHNLGQDARNSIASGLAIEPANSALVQLKHDLASESTQANNARGHAASHAHAPAVDHASGHANGPESKGQAVFIRDLDTLPAEYTTSSAPVTHAETKSKTHATFIPPSLPLTYAGVVSLTRISSPEAYDYWYNEVDPTQLVQAHKGAGIEPETLDYIYHMVAERKGSKGREFLDAVTKCDRYSTAQLMASEPPLI